VSLPTKADYLLDPDIHFLNHGSFGACPRPVFEAYQRWQAELERQPVECLARRATELLAISRAALAAYLGAAADDVVYFPNPTTAINMVARNVARLASTNEGASIAQHSAPEATKSPLRLRPGDEILTTNHEYGALDRTWRYICDQIGVRYVQRSIPLPVTTHADFVEHFWAGVTERTRIIFISHITSPTALIFPVAEICRRARGGDPDDCGRRARAGSAPAKPHRVGRRYLHRRVSQVAQRAERRRVPLRRAAGAAVAGAACGELGLGGRAAGAVVVCGLA
jgi:isopenicillin-N epimerase